MDRTLQNLNGIRPSFFQLIQHQPIGQLKALVAADLELIRTQSIREVREVGRALYWVDELIKLKNNEQETQEQKNKLLGARYHEGE